MGSRRRPFIGDKCPLWKAEAHRYDHGVLRKPSFRRKPNRLDRAVYSVPYAFSLTIVTEGREPVFQQQRFADRGMWALKRAAERNDIAVLAYCFMPDHLHLLVHLKTPGSSVIEFARYFKQLSGYHYKHETGNQLWQKSYYDHAVRLEEDVRRVAQYIFENPVRAGLAASVNEYPHTGSLEWGREALAG